MSGDLRARLAGLGIGLVVAVGLILSPRPAHAAVRGGVTATAEAAHDLLVVLVVAAVLAAFLVAVLALITAIARRRVPFEPELVHRPRYRRQS